MIRSSFERALRTVALLSLSALPLVACGGTDPGEDDTSSSSSTSASTSGASAASGSSGEATTSSGATSGGTTSGGEGGTDPMGGAGGQGGAESTSGTGGGDVVASSSGSGVGEPPVVTINHPGDGETRPAGDPIPFIGLATDAEDGDLADQLAWTSDLDGELGTGAQFSMTLTAGTHVITAEVVDSDDNVGTDAITVTIE